MSKEMREQINKVNNWKQFLNEDSNYLDDNDYEGYIDNAKEVLKKTKKIEKLIKGVTRRGDKYVIIQYIPLLKPNEFEGGEFTRGVKFFYKDDKHLEYIMNILALPMNSLNG